MKPSSESYSSIEKKAFQAIDILRGNVETHDYHAVSFLLYLQKKGIFKALTKLDRSEIKFELLRNLERIENDEEQGITCLFKFFREPISRIEDVVLYSVIEVLGTIDEDVLKLHFKEIIESIVIHIAKSEGRKGGEHIQPLMLTMFICLFTSVLTDLHKGANVYNPFAGLASFGVHLNGSFCYDAQEINPASWAVGMLRLIANNKATQSNFVIGDSIKNWNPNSLKYDLIIANPPLGLRLGTSVETKFGTVKTVESFLINAGLRDLTDNGQLITVVPQGFLFRGGTEKRLREHLVNQDILEMVVSFPGGFLANTGIPFTILVCNKAKADKGSVLFVDAKNIVQNGTYNEPFTRALIQYLYEKKPKHIFNDFLIDFNSSCNLGPTKEYFVAEEFLRTAEELKRGVRQVENIKIVANNYNLNVSRYFISKVFTEEQGVAIVNLGDLLQEIQGERVKAETKGKFVRIRDLKNDTINFHISSAEVEQLEVPKQAHKLEKPALLLATRWNNLKATYIEFNGEPIYIARDIIACEVNEEKVNVAYLINELSAEYVIQQLAGYRVGATIPYITREDLFKVQIKLPSLPEQKEKLIQSFSLKQSYEQAKHIAELNQMKLEMFRELASARHSLNQYLNGISSGIAATHKFLQRNNGKVINLTDRFSEALGTSVEDHLNSLRGKVKLMSELLASLEVKLAKKPVEQVDLVKLVEEAQHLFPGQDVFNYQLELDKESLKNGDSSHIKPTIAINKDDFFKLFSNVVENAKTHGSFKSRSGNIIKVDISYDSSTESLILIIANNGKPLPKGFNKDLYSIRGEKAGNTAQSGIGGADVSQIVRDYNGKFDLINDENADFPVAIKILFPLIKD